MSPNDSSLTRARVPCVFIHGWGMNSAVWQSCQQYLPDWLDAIFVDLPGHGGMREAPAQSLDEHVRAAAAVVSRPAVWVGWSMGGLVALRLAEMFPQKVAAVFLLASTPCFVQRDGWPHAVKPEVFDQFAALLLEDVEKTLKRFLALQSLGVDGSRELMQQLHDSLKSRGLPTHDALTLGLDILQQTDLRDTLANLPQPVGMLLGERDVLAPSALAESLHALAPQTALDILPHAGHTPMLSHPRQTALALQGFIEASMQ